MLGVFLLNHAESFNKEVAEAGVLGGPALNPALADTIPSLSAANDIAAVIQSQPDVTQSLSPASLVALESLGTANNQLTTSPILSGDGAGATPEAPAKGLPRLSRYFIQPTSGLNWGILHTKNAVDIANVCGTPVVAAAEGIVIRAAGGGNWNGGYGNFVEIEHPNGTRTKYSHLQTLAVSAGDSVSQGQNIGAIGATGHVTGATGCHLHFEVAGAVNPFAKK